MVPHGGCRNDTICTVEIRKPVLILTIDRVPCKCYTRLVGEKRREKCLY